MSNPLTDLEKKILERQDSGICNKDNYDLIINFYDELCKIYFDRELRREVIKSQYKGDRLKKEFIALNLIIGNPEAFEKFYVSKNHENNLRPLIQDLLLADVKLSLNNKHDYKDELKYCNYFLVEQDLILFNNKMVRNCKYKTNSSNFLFLRNYFELNRLYYAFYEKGFKISKEEYTQISNVFHKFNENLPFDCFLKTNLNRLMINVLKKEDFERQIRILDNDYFSTYYLVGKNIKYEDILALKDWCENKRILDILYFQKILKDIEDTSILYSLFFTYEDIKKIDTYIYSSNHMDDYKEFIGEILKSKDSLKLKEEYQLKIDNEKAAEIAEQIAEEFDVVKFMDEEDENMEEKKEMLDLEEVVKEEEKSILEEDELEGLEETEEKVSGFNIEKCRELIQEFLNSVTKRNIFTNSLKYDYKHLEPKNNEGKFTNTQLLNLIDEIYEDYWKYKSLNEKSKQDIIDIATNISIDDLMSIKKTNNKVVNNALTNRIINCAIIQKFEWVLSYEIISNYHTPKIDVFFANIKKLEFNLVHVYLKSKIDNKGLDIISKPFINYTILQNNNVIFLDAFEEIHTDAVILDKSEKGNVTYESVFSKNTQYVAIKKIDKKFKEEELKILAALWYINAFKGEFNSKSVKTLNNNLKREEALPIRFNYYATYKES